MKLFYGRASSYFAWYFKSKSKPVNEKHDEEN